MSYRVVFMAIEVDAESEDEAMQEASKRIYEDPEFYFVEAMQIVDEEEQEAE